MRQTLSEQLLRRMADFYKKGTIRMKSTVLMNRLAAALCLGALSLATPIVASAATKPAAKPTAPKPTTQTAQADPKQQTLAALLNRALSDTEKKEITRALDTARLAADNARLTLVETIADDLGLSIDQVKNAFGGAKTQAELIKALSGLLKRTLTAAEIAEVDAATKTFGNALKTAMDELIMTLVSITGLTDQEVASTLQPPPADKPTCNPPTGGTGTTGTTGTTTTGITTGTQSGGKPSSGQCNKPVGQSGSTSSGSTGTASASMTSGKPALR